MQQRTKRAIVLALTLMGCGLVLSGFVALQVQLANDHLVQERLTAAAQNEVAKVERRLANYRRALLNARVFSLANNGHPRREDFARYVNFLNIEREFPGMRGIGVIDKVKASDEQAYITRERAEGSDNFSLRFLSTHQDDRFVIRLIEPLANNRPARGLDIASEPVRRNAALRALERNDAQLTGPITLVQAQDKTTQAFLLLLPVFANWAIPTSDEDKQRSHLGWVYQPLVIEEILRGAGFSDDLFHYEIFDITDSQAQSIFICDDREIAKAVVESKIDREIFGRTWRFHTTPTLKFLQQLELPTPNLIFLKGAVLSLLGGLFSLVALLNLASRRLTQEQNARLVAVFEGTADAIIEVDNEGRIQQWSRGAAAMFGFSREEAVGQKLNRLIAPGGEELNAEYELMAVIEQGKARDIITERQNKEGALLDVMIHMAPLRSVQGKVVGAATIIRDVTQLHAIDHELQQLNANLEQKIHLRTAEVERSRHELETLVNALPIAILALDERNCIVNANEKSKQRFGSGQDTLLGCAIEQALPDNYLAALLPSLAHLPQGQVATGEFSLAIEAGDIHVQWMIIPKLLKGQYCGFYFIEQDITTLKNNKIQLAATLVEQEALLNSINAQFLLSITNAQGKILEVNQPFCEFSGYTEQELVGVSHRIVNSGVHPREFWRRLRKQLLSGHSWRGEVCNRRKNGELYWVDTVITPIPGPDGRAERYLALRSDITARRAAEAERTKLTQLLSSVLNAASEVGIIATDLNGVITVFNRGAERLLGYSSEDMVGKYTPAVFHLGEEIIARGLEMSAQFGELIEGFDVFVYHAKRDEAETRRWTYIRKDGEQVPITLTATAIRAKEGEIVGYLGIAVDIRPQLTAQAKLTELNDQLLQAANVANLGIWTWYLSENRLVWNDQMYNLYQQPKLLGELGQLEYRHWTERLHPQDVAATEEALQKALRGETKYNVIFRVLLPGGETRYVKAQAQVVRDEQGNAVSITGINLDITDRYLYEEELRSARDQAQEANLAKSQFLANMSHEIRTPMNAVLGMLQLLQNTGLTGRQKDYSQNAISAAQSLLGLLNDVLDFSKIEAGKLQLDVHEFSLLELLTNVQIVLTGIQGAKQQVEILFDISRDIPLYVVADKLRLQQILINLTSNALKFTERGFVKLSLELRGLDKNAVKIEVRVEDTGIGIAPEHQEKIFEGFTQAEASTTRRYGGTGLGLVICQRLLKLMNSSLHLSSTLGFGSQFWFTLSLPVGRAQNDITPRRLFEHILLVEDNAQARALFSLDLAEWAGTISTSVSGREAVELITAATQVNADLFIIDWNMAEQNGLQTALAIKAVLGAALPPIIFMVTNEEKEIVYQQCTASGIEPAGVILKPIISWQWHAVFQAIKQPGLPLPPAALVNIHDDAPVLRGLHLLVVEDNELNREVAEGLLTHLGAQVELAFSGLEAVTKLIEQNRQFDLVFMDMQMPIMDGLEATRRIRAQAHLAQLPIVAMTANVSPDDVKACLAAGMNDHVGKPLDIGQILKVMQRYVTLSIGASHPAAKGADMQAITEDWQTIFQRFGKNSKLIRRAIGQFAPELDQQMIVLRAAVEEKDKDTQARCFHSIKGVAATVGASKLAHWGAEQEQSVKAGSAASLTQVEQLAQLTQEAVAAIERLAAENLSAA